MGSEQKLGAAGILVGGEPVQVGRVQVERGECGKGCRWQGMQVGTEALSM
jgi:hypothetical protein